ncbi:MAG: glycosyltransferase [Saprospiraceae bacterium]|nr:glycosyltransferase [Saprospiraceae bacterium]
MRLGFHYHIPAVEINGRIHTLALQGLFLDALAERVEKLVLFLHTPNENERALMDYALSSNNIECYSLGPHNSTPARLLRGRKLARKVAGICREKQIDLLLFRAPTPLLPLIVPQIAPRTHYAYLVVGDAGEHLHTLQQPRWRKFLIQQYIRWNENRQYTMAPKAAVVLTNSPALQHKYPASQLVRTTTLRKTDFYHRTDACSTPPYRILYSGRIEFNKGLLTLARAVVVLQQSGINAILDVVGWAAPGDTTLEHTAQVFEAAGMADKWTFHGKKQAGPQLFAHYREADVFVLPSQSPEGFPRTIWEAMAHCLPVVCTPVGAIPHLLRDEETALFFEAGNAAAAAEKIGRLIDAPQLRRQLTQNAWALAQHSTLEIQTDKIIQYLHDGIA